MTPVLAKMAAGIEPALSRPPGSAALTVYVVGAPPVLVGTFSGIGTPTV
jgi:hypothetical protein